MKYQKALGDPATKSGGLNINGIFRRVNFKEELKSEDYINLQNSINEVNEKIDLINNEMKKIFKFANKRE